MGSSSQRLQSTPPAEITRRRASYKKVSIKSRISIKQTKNAGTKDDVKDERAKLILFGLDNIVRV